MFWLGPPQPDLLTKIFRRVLRSMSRWVELRDEGVVPTSQRVLNLGDQELGYRLYQFLPGQPHTRRKLF